MPTGSCRPSISREAQSTMNSIEPHISSRSRVRPLPRFLRPNRRRLKESCAFAVFSLTVAVGFTGSSQAQEIQDVGSVRQMSIGLTAPNDLQRTKRRRAKKGEWPVTMMAATALGQNSNIFLAPTREQASLVSQGAISAEMLHYFSDSTRISINTAGNGAFHTASSRADSFGFDGSVFIAHRFGSSLKFLMTTRFSRENDDVTRIDGSLLRRNFAANVYRSSPALIFRCT